MRLFEHLPKATDWGYHRGDGAKVRKPLSSLFDGLDIPADKPIRVRVTVELVDTSNDQKELPLQVNDMSAEETDKLFEEVAHCGDCGHRLVFNGTTWECPSRPNQ